MNKPVYARVGNRSHRRSRRKVGKNPNISVNTTIPSVMTAEFSYVVKKTEWSPERPVLGSKQWKGIIRRTMDWKRRGSDIVPPYRIIDPGAPYKPILWRDPKKYERYTYNLEVGPPSVEITEVSPTIKDLKLKVRSSSLPEGDTLWALFKSSPSFSDRQRHYLAFNQRLADQKVDILTAIGEGKSSVTMLANAAKDLFDLYRYVRKGNLRGVKKIFSTRGIKKKVSKHWKNKTAENRWLELTYGWSPLIGDITKAFKELSAQREATLPVIKVVYSTKAGDDFNPLGPLIHPSETWNGTAVYKTACYFHVSSPKVREAAKWNLGNNPLLTAWELVPYSFVVDWFLPIGDFLTQFSASQGLTYISGTSVMYAKGTASGSVTFKGQSSSDFKYVIHVPYRRSMFITDRIVHGTRPIGLPVFTFGLNARRAVNALALVSQRR